MEVVEGERRGRKGIRKKSHGEEGREGNKKGGEGREEAGEEGMMVSFNFDTT